MGGVGNEIHEPVARAKTGKIGGTGVFVRLVELMALGTAHGVAGNQRFAFGNKGGVAPVGVTLEFEFSLGGESGDDFV